MPAPPALEARMAAFAAKYAGLSLSLGESAKPRCLVLSLDGSLDGNNAAAFRELASAILSEAHAFGGMVLELSSVTYISSAGVGAMTVLLSEAKQHDIPFFMKNMTDHVKAVFDVLGFTSFFDFLGDGEGEIK
jgi:anti-anti-sigma factor